MHIGNQAARPGMVNRKPGGIGAKPLPGLHLALITLFRDLRIKAERRQRMHREGREACCIHHGLGAMMQRCPMRVRPFTERGYQPNPGNDDIAPCHSSPNSRPRPRMASANSGAG